MAKAALVVETYLELYEGEVIMFALSVLSTSCWNLCNLANPQFEQPVLETAT